MAVLSNHQGSRIVSTFAYEELCRFWRPRIDEPMAARIITDRSTTNIFHAVASQDTKCNKICNSWLSAKPAPLDTLVVSEQQVFNQGSIAAIRPPAPGGPGAFLGRYDSHTSAVLLSALYPLGEASIQINSRVCRRELRDCR